MKFKNENEGKSFVIDIFGNTACGRVEKYPARMEEVEWSKNCSVDREKYVKKGVASKCTLCLTRTVPSFTSKARLSKVAIILWRVCTTFRGCSNRKVKAKNLNRVMVRDGICGKLSYGLKNFWLG